MADLSAKQLSFVAMMTKSDEHARRGFTLILKRSDPLKFFDALLDAGLFAPAQNPDPVSVPPEGHVRIPYWAALDYLVACARFAGTADDLDLGRKLLTIVRAVSIDAQSAPSADNFHTFRKFAEVIGLLPTPCVSRNDLRLIRAWLTTRFNRYLVAIALDEGPLTSFLASDDPPDWRKAIQLLAYCTAVRWEPSRFFSEARDPVTIVHEYWLRRLLSHHVSSLGDKNPVTVVAARLFASRVRQIFGSGDRAQHTYAHHRSVAEDRRDGDATAESCAVQALRDLLLTWCDATPADARVFMRRLLRSDNQMVRRIGIFVLGQRWKSLRELYLDCVGPEFFQFGHLHEAYGLLHDHFGSFDDAEREATLEAIRNLPTPSGDDGVALRERFQRRWLTAIAGSAYRPAVEWLAELTQRHGPQPEYPERQTSITTHWGPGPSPYGVDQLVAFATEGTIVEKLSTLTPDHTSTHRTSEALVDALTSAVDAAPVVFSSVFLTFLAVPRQYQYGLVRGLLAHRRRILAGTAKGVWDDVVWSRLFSFLEELLEDSRHRSRTPAQPPGTVDGWLTEAVADLLHEGTREDEHAYPPVFLPRGWALIEKLVSGADAVAAPSDDPMTQAINSPKGRALEAAFSHILRDCRLADRETGAHDAAWSSARRLVERELALCVNSNFEFSTLAAAYLGSFEYIDVRWLEDHIQEFFPKSYTTNLGCALGGLAYAWMSRGIYRILRDAGIVDIALQLEIKREHSRTKLMERLALGYLWEEESLDSERFAYLFEHDCTEDLQSINFFFWSIRGETLKPEQVRKVVDYWRHCVKWARDRPEPPAKVLSSLGGLSRFLESAGGEDRELLLAVAPYVDTNGNAYEFIRELVRLVETSPAEVCDVFERLVDKHELLYDYEGRIQTLVRRLADLGFRREAIDLCNKLRSLPGVVDLFRELTAESGRS